MKKCFLILSFLFIFFFYSGFAYAQSGLNTTGPTQISVQTIPEIPGPSQNVQATIQSYGTDLDTATISWSINGKKELSGKGEKVFYFKTSTANTTTTLDVTVTTSMGEVIKKSFKIKPNTVDIIWQNDSYVPPFYKGKALFSYQNKITFIAIPHILGSNGKEINPSNLIYKWTKNGTVVGDYSGYGKNTYTMISTIIARPLNMEVEVTSPTSDDVARSSVYVAPIDPKILMYEKNPLYGFMFEKALTGNVSFDNLKEIEITAVPFFFGTTYSKNPSLNYKWTINYGKIDDDTTQTSRIFRPKEGSNGSSYISVSIDNTDKVLQSAKYGFNIEFNNKEKTSTE